MFDATVAAEHERVLRERCRAGLDRTRGRADAGRGRRRVPSRIRGRRCGQQFRHAGLARAGHAYQRGHPTGRHSKRNVAQHLPPRVRIREVDVVEHDVAVERWALGRVGVDRRQHGDRKRLLESLPRNDRGDQVRVLVAEYRNGAGGGLGEQPQGERAPDRDRAREHLVAGDVEHDHRGDLARWPASPR